jgi:undecaprenyl-diphosphatase
MNLALAVALHSGSIMAVLYWFRDDIVWLWHNFCAWLVQRLTIGPKQVKRGISSNNSFIVRNFFLSLIPTAVLGSLLKPFVKDVFENPSWATFFLVINGFIILAAAHWTHGEHTLQELTWKEFLLIGFIQGLGVLPGVSRLGITLCAGLFLHLNWYEALRLTFMLAIPVIAGSILFEIITGDVALMITGVPGGFIGMAFSIFVVVTMSWFALKLLMRSWLERRTLVFFGHYCWMVGLFGLIYMCCQ